MSDFPLLLATETDVTRRTVTRWCEAGKVPGAYQTKGGHWRWRRPRSNEWLDENLAKFVGEELIRKVKILLPHYDEAVELTFAVAGITDDDIRAVAHPDRFQRKRNRAALKKRDRRKWRLLCRRDFFDVRQGAFEALSQPKTRLRMKAVRLNLNGIKLTPKNLAGALSISTATLYRRFGREAVRSACDGIPVRAEYPASVRYQLTGLENRQKNGNGARRTLVSHRFRKP